MLKKNKEIFEILSLISHVGLTLLVSILIGTFAGIWIGRQFGVDWPAILGFFVGAASGFLSVYRIMKKYIHITDNAKNIISIKEKEGQVIKDQETTDDIESQEIINGKEIQDKIRIERILSDKGVYGNKNGKINEKEIKDIQDRTMRIRKIKQYRRMKK